MAKPRRGRGGGQSKSSNSFSGPANRPTNSPRAGAAAPTAAFGNPASGSTNRPSAKASRAQGIPERVANRMARRIAIATGTPTLLGMGVFVASYWLVSHQILEIAPGVTLAASGGCFLLGLLGLSYGVLSSSWEESPGSLLGGEQIGLNVSRLRASFQTMRTSRESSSDGRQR